MCGVFGIRAPDRDVARLAHFGLHALQHRGQESAGIAVSDRGRLTVLREMGLVAQVFNEQNLRGLHGELAIGHTRYSTTGSAQWANAQPLVQHGRARTVALGHNGNLVNAGELRDELHADGIQLGSTSDTELIAALIANDPAPLERGGRERDGAARGRVLRRRALRGQARSRSATRTASGRSCSAGSTTTGSSPPRPARSTSSAPSSSARSRRGELRRRSTRTALHAAPGRRRRRARRALHLRVLLPRPPGLAARRASRCTARACGWASGSPREAPVEADLVLPIPDSGTPAAIGFARATGIPFSEGLIKNRYVGRTFIQPDQELREQGIRLKFNPLAEVAGKRVVVVDDSIVRGNTTRQIVAMLFDAGATEVHVRDLVAAGDRARASTGSTSPTRSELDRRRAARSRRCASRSARPRSPTSRSRASRRRPRGPSSSLCRACLTGAVPDADPGGPPAREAPVRAGARLALRAPVDRDQDVVVRRARRLRKRRAAACRPSRRTGACPRRAPPGTPSG